MIRRRFAKLAPEQQQAIRRAALEEFAVHGFHDASLNRVIEKAGISKGSMYYYFDGKQDLYSYVVKTEIEGFITGLGPFTLPSDGDADAFWSTLEDHYRRLMTALASSPRVADLIRGWIAASTSPALHQAQQQVERDLLPWLERTLEHGQRVGAVRRDLPSTLLIAVVVGMGQAMDIWLLTRQPDRGELPRLIGALIGMIRRAVEP